VTASRDRSARAWNTHTCETESELKEGHEYLASSALFFPDGLNLVTSGVDNTTRLWNVATGGQTRMWKGTGRAAALAVSRNQRWIATGASRSEETGRFDAQLWNADKDDRIGVFQGHRAEVNAVAFAPDDSLLATGDLLGDIRLWNIKTGELVSKLEGHSGKITALRFLNQGSRLVSSSIDKSVGQWDVASGKEIKSLLLKHPDAVLAIEIIPGTEQIVTSCADRAIRVWDQSNGTLIQTIKSFEYVAHHPIDDKFVGPSDSDFHSISISANGKQLITADSIRRTVHLWDLVANREIPRPRGGELGPWITLQKNAFLWSTTFHPVNDEILTVGGNTARLWDVKSNRERKTFSPNETIASARYSPDSKWIATSGWDSSIKVWDVETRRVQHKLKSGLTDFPDGHTGNVNSTFFSSDSRHLLTASDDKTAKIWDVKAEKVLLTLKGHAERVRSAIYSPDGRLVATASDDKTVRIWNATSGEFVRDFRGHLWGVGSVEFSPDGKLLLTGSDDTSAQVWDVATGEIKFELSGHTASVTSVAISPDGLRILTGSQDHSAKLWDVTAGREILTFRHHRDEVTSVNFSPDGSEILTSSRDGTAVILLSKDNLDDPIDARQTSSAYSRLNVPFKNVK